MVLDALPDPVVTAAAPVAMPASDAPQAPALSYDFLAKNTDAGCAGEQTRAEAPQNPLAGLVPVTGDYTAAQPEAAPAYAMAATAASAAVQAGADCDDADEYGSDPASFLSAFGITVSGGADACPPIAS